MAEETQHIRAVLMASPALPMGPRTVLAEVVAMCEHGSRHCYDANNAFLAKKLGKTIPKISEYLSTLKRCGLLDIEGTGNGKDNTRTITPSAKLANHYRNDKGTLTEMLREAYQNGKATAGVKTKIPSANPSRNGKGTITETVRDDSRNDKGTLTETGANPYRNDNHNSKELKGEGEGSETYTELIAANAAFQKKIGELEGKLKTARELYKADQRTIQDLQVENAELRANATTPVAQPEKKPGRAKKSPADVCPVHNEAIKVFEAEFLKRNKIPYDFEPKDAKAIQGILKHLQRIAPDNDWDTALGLFTSVITGWDKLGTWHSDKFNLPYIKSQINVILSKISGKLNPAKRPGINVDTL